MMAAKRATLDAKRQAKKAAVEVKKAAAEAKRQAKKAIAEAKKATVEAKRQAREEKKVAAALKRHQAQAERSKRYPSTTWESRFWGAVEKLHPSLRWDNAGREKVYSSIVSLWRAHRWTPEEAAQAICLQCEVPTTPPQAAPVASGGRALLEPVRAKPKVRGAALRPTTRPDLPDLPPVRSPRTCPTDRAECGYAVQGGACTVSARLTVPGRSSMGTEQIPARYCIVEIGQLHTSHLPLRGFRPNPNFPPTAQERDYGQQSEQAKVLEIAKTYDPALIFNTSPGAIDGVPVATEEGIVLGGNGRTMATRLVYAGEGRLPADTPRAYLVEHAHEFGLDAEVVSRFQAPMLVRTVRLAQDPRSLAEWSRRLNVSLSQQLDPIHLAVSRARFLGDSALRELAAMEEEETLASFLSSARSRAFIRALQASGVIDGRAAPAYLGSDGLLNEVGRDLVANLLVAVLLPDAQLIGALGRGPVATIARGAPALVTTTQAQGYDLRESLQAAAQDRIAMRAQGITDVRSFLRQQSLFSTTSAVGNDSRAKLLLQVLVQLEASPLKFAKFSRTYAELAQAHPVSQRALFDQEKITPEEALRLAAQTVGVKCPCEGSADHSETQNSKNRK